MAKKWIKMALPFSFGMQNTPSRSGSSSSSSPNNSGHHPLRPAASQPILAPPIPHRFTSSLPIDTRSTAPDEAMHMGGSLSSSSDLEHSSSFNSLCLEHDLHGCDRRRSEISVQTDGDLTQGLSPAEVDFLKEEFQRAVANAEDAMKCIICLNKGRDTLFSPCHHLVTCDGCSKLLPLQTGVTGSSRHCPLCRRAISKVTRVFLS